MNMKKFVALALALVLAMPLGLLAGCSGSGTSDNNSSGGSTDDYYNFTFSMHSPLDSPIGHAYQAMFDDINERTNGHVTITPYGSATLASSSDVVDMVTDGGCDIGWVFTMFYYGQYPLTDVTSLVGNNPDSSAEGARVLYALFDEYEEVANEWSAFKVLTMYGNPTNHIYTNKKVSSLEEISGQTLRVPSGSVNSVLSAMGVNVISCAPNDIFDNISKGNIDGYVFEPTGVDDYSLAEVTDYMLDLNTHQCAVITIMNKDSYNSLPAEYQAIFDEYSTLEASLKFASVWDTQVDELMSDMESAGVEIISMTQDDLDLLASYADTYAETWVEEQSANGFDAAGLLERCRELYAAE